MKLKMKIRSASRVKTGLDCFKALKALSDPRRIAILNLLLTEQLTAGRIATRCKLTTYTASRQLSALQQAGLLNCIKDGQKRVYGLSPACEVLVNRSTRTLDLKCCQFQLDAIVANAR